MKRNPTTDETESKEEELRNVCSLSQEPIFPDTMGFQDPVFFIIIKGSLTAEWSLLGVDRTPGVSVGGGDWHASSRHREERRHN